MNDIMDISLPNSISWYYDNGYLTIDLELFGKNLCAIFTKFLNQFYYFQTFTPTIETDKDRPIWQQGKECRNLVIISPNSYNYNKVRTIHAASQNSPFMTPFTIYSKDYPSLFSKAPLKLGEKDFLLYFGNYANEDLKISLGDIVNGRFIPTKYFRSPGATHEVIYANPDYLFIDEFLKAIFYYKVLNNKPNLNQDDMDLILEELGISKEEKLQSLMILLGNIKEDATKALLESNNVGSILALRKGNKTE